MNKNNNIIIYCFFVSFFLSCATTQRVFIDVPPSFNTDKIYSMAILEFENKSDYYDAGSFATNKLEYYLVVRSNFKIVERRRIQNALDELNLGMTGLIDSETAKKIGKLLSADVLVTGIVYGNYKTRYGNTIFDNDQTYLESKYETIMKVIDVESGEILYNHSYNSWWNASFKTAPVQSEVATKLIDMNASSLAWDFLPHKTEITYKTKRTVAYLGVYMKDIDEQIKNRYGYNKDTGVIVDSVEPNSPASLSGIRRNDIIYSIDNLLCVHFIDVQYYIQNKKTVGDVLMLKIFRDSVFIDLNVKLGSKIKYE